MNKQNNNSNLIEQKQFSSFYGKFDEGENPLQPRCYVANTGVSHSLPELTFVSVEELFNNTKEKAKPKTLKKNNLTLKKR